jgi:ubiquinone/menaquinone biosynthesis C-methylase UbiE
MSAWDEHIELFSDEPFTEEMYSPSRLFIPQIAVGKTLECGCASALDFLHFHALGKPYFGIDITQAFLAKARKRGAPVAFGSICSLDFENRSFDTVYCRNVLEHLSLDDGLRAIDEMIRVTTTLCILEFFIHPLDKASERTDKLGFQNTVYAHGSIVERLSKLGSVTNATFAGDTECVYMADARTFGVLPVS